VAHAQGGGRRFACAGEGGRSFALAGVGGGARRLGGRAPVWPPSIGCCSCIYLKGSRICKFHQSLPGELASYMALRREDRRFDS
jgi:hypothetical protein